MTAAAATERKAPLLEIRGLSRRFGGVLAVDGLDLELAEGELRAIIGPNGCGKTTLFNLISGELRPDAGDLRFAGRDLVALPPHAIARLGILRKFQVPSVYEELTVAENLLVASHLAGGDEDPGLPAEVGLGERRQVPAGHLSHGEKQWLEIAMVLACRPRLLLLDEPTAGMTRAETARTAALIRRLHAERGVAMIIIEHDMRFVAALDCPVSVMMRGRILVTGSYEEVGRHPQVREAYLGDASARGR